MAQNLQLVSGFSAGTDSVADGPKTGSGRKSQSNKEPLLKLDSSASAKKRLREQSRTTGFFEGSIAEGDARYLARDFLSHSVQDLDLKRCDMFSVGITMFELATGVDLTTCGEHWQAMRPDTADELKQFL